MKGDAVWWGATVLAAVVTTAAPRGADGLRSFYIATPPGFNHPVYTITSVEPVGRDVRVRVIRIEALNEFCPKPLVVRAAERTLPHTTVQAIARVDVCGMSQDTVDAAFARSKTPRVDYVDYMGSVQTVVANCNGQERVLILQDAPPWVNFETLRRTAPGLSALWNLNRRLSDDRLSASPRTPHTASETLGTSLVPELRSAKYAAAFGDELSRELEGYSGPPARRDLLPAEVLDRDALPLVTFVAPPLPPIALAARLFGDVRLRLAVDPTTGAVDNVERLVDKPFLGDAAVQAVRSWRFDPARVPREPVDVTVRFQVRCGTD